MTKVDSPPPLPHKPPLHAAGSPRGAEPYDGLTRRRRCNRTLSGEPARIELKD